MISTGQWKSNGLAPVGFGFLPPQAGGLVAHHEVRDDSKRVVAHGLGRASPVLSGMPRKKR